MELSAINVDIAEFEGPRFDPVQWLDSKVKGQQSTQNAKKIDDYLSSLATALQFKSQDVHESIEVSAAHLVNMVPAFMADIARMKQETCKCLGRLGSLLGELNVVDSDQQESLAFLSEVDSAKGKLETAQKVLTEIHQWDYKTREVEALLVSGNLAQVCSHLGSMQHTVEILETIPEFSSKIKVLQRYKDQLRRDVAEKLKHAVKANSLVDMRQCAEVYGKLGMKEDFYKGLDASFRGLSGDMWRSLWAQTQTGMGMGDGGDSIQEASSPAASDPTAIIREDEALVAYFERFSKAIEDRVGLLTAAVDSLRFHASPPPNDKQTISNATGSILKPKGKKEKLDNIDMGSPPPSKAGKPAPSKDDLERFGEVDCLIVLCIKAATDECQEDIIKLLEKYEHAPDAPQICERLLHGYEASWQLLCATPGIANAEGRGQQPLWTRMKDLDGSVLPIKLFEVWASVQVSGLKKEFNGSPPVGQPGQPAMAPSQAVLAAESDAVKVFWKAAQSIEPLRDNEHALAAAAPVWLAVVDTVCSEYWGRWIRLVDIFQNTISAKANKGAASGANVSMTLDIQFLQTCLQFNGLVRLLVERFEQLETGCVESAAQVWYRHSRFNAVAKAMVRKYGHYSLPSHDAVTRCTAVLNATPNPHIPQPLPVPPVGDGEGGQIGPKPSDSALLSSKRQLAALRQRVDDLVCLCCTFPVTLLLQGYVSSVEWTSPGDKSEFSASMPAMPTHSVTWLGEHLLSLVPQLDAHQTSGSSAAVEWLPRVVGTVSSSLVSKAKEIPIFTPAGLRQLSVDLTYVSKVVSALGEDTRDLRAFARAASNVAQAASFKGRPTSPSRIPPPLPEDDDDASLPPEKIASFEATLRGKIASKESVIQPGVPGSIGPGGASTLGGGV